MRASLKASLRSLPGVFAAAAVAFLALALGVRVGFGDRLLILRPLVYATPLPLDGLLAIAASLALAILGKRRAAVLLLAAAAAIGFTWWRASHVSHVCAGATAGTFRLLLWNVADGNYGYHRVDEVIRSEDADAAILIEADERPLRGPESWAEAHPSRHLYDGGLGILFLTREPPLSFARLRDPAPKTHAAQVRLRLADGTPFRLFAADFDSGPGWPKEHGVERLAELAGGADDAPAVVAGDFNAPLDAGALAALRDHFPPALSAAGSGFVETWPSLAPVLAIDHVFVDRRLRVTCARKRCFLVPSDHCAIVVELALAPIAP